MIASMEKPHPKAVYLDNNFWKIPRTVAKELSKPYSKRLPMAGRELAIILNGKSYWLSQTLHKSRHVWTLREAAIPFKVRENPRSEFEKFSDEDLYAFLRANNRQLLTSAILTHNQRRSMEAKSKKAAAELRRRGIDPTKRFPRGNPPRRRRRETFHPPYRVDVWEERDRLSIVVYDRDDKTVAEWWDDDARQMFEDGFFERRNLESSVLKYLQDMGTIGSLYENPPGNIGDESGQTGGVHVDIYSVNPPAHIPRKVLEWLHRQPHGSIMSTKAFDDIKQRALKRYGSLARAKDVAGRAYWNTVLARYKAAHGGRLNPPIHIDKYYDIWNAQKAIESLIMQLNHHPDERPRFLKEDLTKAFKLLRSGLSHLYQTHISPGHYKENPVTPPIRPRNVAPGQELDVALAVLKQAIENYHLHPPDQITLRYLRNLLVLHLDQMGASIEEYRDNPPATEIYRNIVEIRAQKADGKLYRHPFGKGSTIWGLPNGTLLIKSRKGKRLWKNFPKGRK